MAAATWQQLLVLRLLPTSLKKGSDVRAKAKRQPNHPMHKHVASCNRCKDEDKQAETKQAAEGVKQAESKLVHLHSTLKENQDVLDELKRVNKSLVAR